MSTAESVPTADEDEVEHPEVPVNPEEPGTSGLPDPQPDKGTEGGEGGRAPVEPDDTAAADTEASASSVLTDANEANEAAASFETAEAGATTPGEAELAAAEAAVADDVDELARVAAERDEYLDALRHLQADFENFRKRVHKEQTAAADRGAESLVRELLPALDAADLARFHDEAGSVEPVVSALADALGKQGLERIDPAGLPFDPEEHEAVMHEPGDGEPEVLEVLRAGYRWKGRMLRPAMVKVKGS